MKDIFYIKTYYENSHNVNRIIDKCEKSEDYYNLLLLCIKLNISIIKKNKFKNYNLIIKECLKKKEHNENYNDIIELNKIIELSNNLNLDNNDFIIYCN